MRHNVEQLAGFCFESHLFFTSHHSLGPFGSLHASLGLGLLCQLAPNQCDGSACGGGSARSAGRNSSRGVANLVLVYNRCILYVCSIHLK